MALIRLLAPNDASHGRPSVVNEQTPALARIVRALIG
jgi:hypothetical protein